MPAVNTGAPHDAWLVDLDGTLYVAPPVKLAMAAELAVAGRQALGILRRFRAEHEALRREASAPIGDPFRLQIERTARALDQPPDRVEAVVSEWMLARPGKWLRRFRRRTLIAELSEFRRAGGRLALVSDYPATAKLHALGCADLFEVVVASGERGGPRRLKPDPDGYLIAATRLRVDPERCQVLGDRRDADGEAARRAGMAFRRIA